jgi:hypothetical protein
MARNISLLVGGLVAAMVLALGISAAGLGPVIGPSPAAAQPEQPEPIEADLAAPESSATSSIVLVAPDGSITTIEVPAASAESVVSIVQALQQQLGVAPAAGLEATADIEMAQTEQGTDGLNASAYDDEYEQYDEDEDEDDDDDDDD